MKLPKNYFNNLSASKYREYLKLLPNIQQENTRIITTLILTFFAMSFFGIFAINPTLSTIITLRKQLADSELVHEKLKAKIAALSTLHQQYATLQADLPTVMEAIPQYPDPPALAAQVLGLAKQRNIKILSMTTSEVQLKNTNANVPKQTAPPAQGAAAVLPAIPLPAANPPSATTETETPPINENSYTFSLQVQGSYADLIGFAQSLSQLSRVITIDSLSVNKDSKQNVLTMAISAKAYFQK